MNMVKTTTIDASDVDIMISKYPDTIGCQVGNTGVATSNGVKWIPAGTPVGHSTKNVLEDRTTVLEVCNSSSTGANAQGVLLHGVDVTSGNANATLVIRGTIDSTKCPTIDSTAKTALTHIIWVKGE